jgi:hypothetical protein
MGRAGRRFQRTAHPDQPPEKEATDVTVPSALARATQPLRATYRAILFRIVDREADPATAKAMLTDMYERGMMSAVELEAQIAVRGLGDA